MVMSLCQGADLHVAQLMPLPLTISCSSKFRLVGPDKIQEGLKTCVCVCVCVYVCVCVCVCVRACMHACVQNLTSVV